MEGAVQRLRRRRDRIPVPLAAFVLLAGLYAATATWGTPYGIDPWTNAVTGWYLANEGTPVAADHDRLVELGWFVDTDRGPVAQYPPGGALTVAPFYLLSGVTPDDVPAQRPTASSPASEATRVPPVWPATLSAMLVTAGFAATLAATLQQIGTSRRDALLASLAAGVCTSAWSVASDRSWLHGPAMLAIGLGTWAASRDRWLLCGLSLGAGILVRPHIAAIAAVVGLWVSVARRDWRPAVLVGTGAGLGLLALLVFNAVVFGEPSVSGGYPSDFAERAASGDLVWYAVNVAKGLFHGRYGLLMWAPFLPILVLVAWRDRATFPDWSVASAVGGLLYLLIQWKANRASGGLGFFPYRYPLAALAAAAPLLAVAALRCRDRSPRRVTVLLCVTLAWAAIGQSIGAVVQ